MDLAFHRLARSRPNYRWWRGVVTGLIAFAFYILLVIPVTVLFAVPLFTDPEGLGRVVEDVVISGVIDNSVPIVLALSLASVALMLPAIILARLIMGPRPVGLLSAVSGRLRWGWMLRLLLPALAVFALSYAVSFFVIPLIAGEEFAQVAISDSTWWLLAVTLLLVPVQATAEEYVFRGYLMQLIGGWLRHPLWAILIPVPLFMAGHLYDVWGLIDVGVFALFAGWITWRTGGLEAAIVAHVVNNASIFALGAFGLVDVNASEGNFFGIVMTAVVLGLYSLLVVRLAARHDVQRTRRVDPPVAVALPDAVLVSHEGRPAVQLSRVLPVAAEQLWDAVSSPSRLASWFPSSVSFTPVLGTVVSFSGDPNLPEGSTGLVLAFDAPRHFAFSWGENTLHFVVTPVSAVESSFTLTDVLSSENEAARNAAGWDVCLASLVAVVSSGRPGAAAGAVDWRRRYEHYVAAGMPSGAAVPVA